MTEIFDYITDKVNSVSIAPISIYNWFKKRQKKQDLENIKKYEDEIKQEPDRSQNE
jgi:hypothetical protein